MSGLLALLDDVATLAKLAASSIDDVAAAAAKSGAKSAGAVIDDAAVTPKYLHGLEPARELPMIWRIARRSIINKVIILLPIALLLSAFAPWLIAPFLGLGGLYLSFEGAEKILHALGIMKAQALEVTNTDPAHLEETKVQGAIKTDFILSAEIMTIALANLPAGSVGFQAAVLAVVAVAITLSVYGVVALIIKMDDIGLYLYENAKASSLRTFGAAMVSFMPKLLYTLTVVGTAAMLWVGGSIIIHAVAQMGFHAPEHIILDLTHKIGQENAIAIWSIEALLFALLAGFSGAIIATILSVFHK